MIYQGKRRVPVQEVVLHTSATPKGWATGKTAEEMRDEFRLWHTRDNGWRDIGYHRVGAPDGTMAIGRSMYEIGAHVAGQNSGKLGLCLVPVNAVLKLGKFEDFYTPAQRHAVRTWIAEVAKLTDLVRVSGHNDYANRLCPGFKVHTKDWL